MAKAKNDLIALFIFASLASLVSFIFLFQIFSAAFIASNAYAAGLPSGAANTNNNSNKNNANKNYYSENKKYIILKLTGTLLAYINKNDQKVYYYYKGKYYLWNKGIWFDSKKISSIFKITKQSRIPAPLKNGPILKVKRKKTPASGFAVTKVPPPSVKNRLPKAATAHLYNFPLTMHGLVIYEKRFNLTK